ncbi:CotH kinase family protein [uncultured Fibrobacter sp.]|uniref:CotH kinase family protein n=1 Tax=uncultured Fibrobacter sp. TaxID=261512 RepID=UPI00261E65EA|nr:CotH kinase family protein [uncultured Fibrobacter sp.]
MNLFVDRVGWWIVVVFLCACTDYKNELLEPHEVGPVEEFYLSSSAAKIPDFPVKENAALVISEVDPINIDYKDHEGGDAGWVEIVNKSSRKIDLSGYSLTDNLKKKHKWDFGKVVLHPSERLVVFMSGKDYPDFVPPSDSVNMIGKGCSIWTDAQNDPPGKSFAEPLPGKKGVCFSENGHRVIGARMQLHENVELGWSSISVFVGTRGGGRDQVMDLTGRNELLLTGYVPKDCRVSLRLAQPDVDEKNGYEVELTGTGDSSTTYSFSIPEGTDYPDLANIYGTRFSPGLQETRLLDVKFTSYVVRNRGREPHASFKLDKDGGDLYLLDSMGEVESYVFYPEAVLGKSWSLGQCSASEECWGYAVPSPYKEVQEEVLPLRSPEIQELPPSGFYQDAFDIEFPANQLVRCEKGGMLPSAESPQVVSLRVKSNTVLRCASFFSGTLPGDVETRTYIFENPPTVPAVFIAADSNSLFNADSGIYVKGDDAWSAMPYYGANYWQDKEIPIFIELMEPGKQKPAFAENAGYSIFGNYSRASAKKSAAITFREKYGKKRLEYKLFPEFPSLKKFRSFLLRNNGSGFSSTYFLDRLASSVTEGLGIDYQRGRAAVVFYNGVYFGLHNIRERSSKYYFETHYGYDPDQIDLLKADNTVSAGDASDFISLSHWLNENYLDDEENYEYFASQVDVDNFLNYMLSEIFLDNRDWPANNVKKWRRSDTESPWKWFLYDLDFGFGSGFNDSEDNIFDFVTAENGPDWPNGPKSTLLLRRLLDNEGFRTAFINRMTTLLSMNFESSRLLARIEALNDEIADEIARDQKRWNLSARRMDDAMSQMISFAKTRQAVVIDELMEHFNLQKKCKVELISEGRGTIAVHGLPLDRSDMYITFFKGEPVTLSAQPHEGSRFVGWDDGSDDSVIEILPCRVTRITASFR